MSSAKPASAACDYCGLPLRGSARKRAQREPEYCCFGCRFAAAINDERGDCGAVRWTLTRLGLGVFFTMNESVFSMALWTGDVYARDPTGGVKAATLEELFRYLSLLFALPVLWLLGGPLAANAWRDLRASRFSVDLLLVAGVVASFAYSMVNVFRGAGQIYFEVGCVVLTMVTLGRWLEAAGKLKTTESLSALEKLLPESARVRRNDRWVTIPLGGLESGDVVRVLPGERLPTDGRVINAVVSVDEQLLTGESRPAVKEPGDALLGGALNLDGDLWMEVSAPASAGTLSRLIEAVRAARLRKGRYERTADCAAAWFTPAVTAIAFGTFVAHTAAFGWDAGLMASLAVVLIACPCALGIATPMAIWAALGKASQNQVLFRHGEALERLATIRAIRFDKTGTLTTGVAELSDAVMDADVDQVQIRSVVTALAAGSNHILAKALAEYCGAGDQEIPLDNIVTVPGRGLRARRSDTGAQVVLGNLPFMREQGLLLTGPVATRANRALDDGESLTLVGWNDRVRAVFVFQEQLRDEVRPALRQCESLGIDLAVLTGDHAARGRALGQELGIRVESELLPEQKLAAIARAQRELGPVAMVGDGVNDAPAMAASDVGIAMGSGADLTRDAASICLIANDLARLPWAIDLARSTVRIIRQNLFWAFAYNVVGILLAAAGWLNPIWAAAAMVISSLFVVANSLRLRSAALADEPVDNDEAVRSQPNASHETRSVEEVVA